jgi:peptide/nickel transport system substrate-binding protein
MEVTQHPRRRRALALGAIALSTALAVTGCTVSDTGAAGDTVLTVAASASVTTWNPISSFSTEALYLGNVYETLLWRNADGAAEEFTPGLAESWEASEDGLTWTFHLREGAVFHDGEPVTAEAVKLSIEAAAAEGGASFIWAPLESVEAPDELTAVFTLSYSAPLDLIAASTYGAWIVSPKALEAAASDDAYFESGIDAGSGPYTVDSYTSGKEVVLKRFDDHWNQDNLPHYEIVDIAITADAITAQQMLTSGEVDFATTIPLENIDTVASEMGAEVRTANSPFNFVALFNTVRPPLDDPKVRQALSYALPYDDIIQVGAQGYGTQSRAAVPKGIYPYSDEIPQYTQDLDKAAELLAEAGHADGFDLTLTYASENPAEARFVPLIKDALAKIGVNVEVRGELFNQQWENAKADPATAQDIFVLYYWPTYSDAGADNLYSLFHSSDAPFFNLAYWNNPEFDDLIDTAATLSGSDRAEAQRLYLEAMTLLVDQAPGAFLYDPQAVTIVPANLNVGQFNENYPFTTFFAPITPAS